MFFTNNIRALRLPCYGFSRSRVIFYLPKLADNKSAKALYTVTFNVGSVGDLLNKH